MAGTEPFDNGSWEIHTLDVDQADSTLHITEDGELTLIDADKTEIVEPLDEILDDRTNPQQDGNRIPLHLLVTHLHDDLSYSRILGPVSNHPWPERESCPWSSFSPGIIKFDAGVGHR